MQEVKFVTLASNCVCYERSCLSTTGFSAISQNLIAHWILRIYITWVGPPSPTFQTFSKGKGSRHMVLIEEFICKNRQAPFWGWTEYATLQKWRLPVFAK